MVFAPFGMPAQLLLKDIFFSEISRTEDAGHVSIRIPFDPVKPALPGCIVPSRIEVGPPKLHIAELSKCALAHFPGLPTNTEDRLKCPEYAQILRMLVFVTDKG